MYIKIILILFGLAYLISPVDIIPDLLLPFVGWIDDGVVIGTIYYLIRYGKLPNFFFKRKNPFNQPHNNNNNNNSNFNKRKTSNQNSNYRQNSKNTNSNSRFNSNTGKKTDSKSDSKFQSKSVPTPHEILGINRNATKEEVQQAYRQSIKKYHPDKLSHLGKDFSNLANDKFLEIQRAYDALMKKYKA